MAGILKTVPGGSPSPSPPAQASNFFKAMAELDLCTTRDKYGLFHLLTVRRDLDVYRETLAAAKERLAAAPHPGGVSTRNAPGGTRQGFVCAKCSHPGVHNHFAKAGNVWTAEPPVRTY